MKEILIGTWAWGTGINGSKMVFGKKQNPEILKQSFEEAVKYGFLNWDTAAVNVTLSPEEIACIEKEADATGIRQQGTWEPQ